MLFIHLFFLPVYTPSSSTRLHTVFLAQDALKEGKLTLHGEIKDFKYDKKIVAECLDELYPSSDEGGLEGGSRYEAGYGDVGYGSTDSEYVHATHPFLNDRIAGSAGVAGVFFFFSIFFIVGLLLLLPLSNSSFGEFPPFHKTAA